MSRRFLVVIPARKGSKGIPNKNFLNLGQKSIIEYSIDFALNLLDDCDLVISTDNFDFLDSLKKRSWPTQIEELSAKSIRDRDQGSIYLDYRVTSLALDNTPITVVLQAIVSQFESSEIEIEGVLLLQPTSPFRSKKDLQRIRSFLKSKANADASLVSFKEVNDHHPARMYIRENSDLFTSANFYPGMEQVRRQELPQLFIRDGAFYFIGANLLTNGQQFNPNPIGLIRNFPWNINLDQMTDLLVAQSIVTRTDYFKEEE